MNFFRKNPLQIIMSAVLLLSAIAIFFLIKNEYFPGKASATAGNSGIYMFDSSTLSNSTFFEGSNEANSQESSQEKNDASAMCQSHAKAISDSSFTANKKALPIYHVNTDEKKISLSFDAAWGADDTLKILDILDKNDVKVTFFMTGGWVNTYPDLVKEIYNRGHDLGNHSESHKQMSTLSSSNQRDEIMSVNKKVNELTGYNIFLFRPPYGDYNNALIKTIYGCGLYPIQWTVDSLDWKDYGVDSIIKTVTCHKQLGNGAIILMHNGAKYTPDALDTVISTLKTSGYELVPISQLIMYDNFHMDTSGNQVKD